VTIAAAPAHSFDDGDAYERFMGRWSRAVAEPFLHWLAPVPGGAWLDVGCGTGAFAAVVLDRAAPVSIMAIDPSPAQVAFATRRTADSRATFQVADAQALPFADGTFDIVCAALVLNFVRDPSAALAEMRRVARPGALVAAYVWDFKRELSPSGPLRGAMRRVGLAVPAIPGTPVSTIGALTGLFAAAGLGNIVSRRIEVASVFVNFTEYWRSQMPSYAPSTTVIDQLNERERRALMQVLHETLPRAQDGAIRCVATANAIKGFVSD
jgi:SAM-dependent methyltransferase